MRGIPNREETMSNISRITPYRETLRRCASAGPPEKPEERRQGWWWYYEIRGVDRLRPIIAKAYAEHSTADLNRILSEMLGCTEAEADDFACWCAGKPR